MRASRLVESKHACPRVGACFSREYAAYAAAELIVMRCDELVRGGHAHGERARDVWDRGGDVRDVVEVIVARFGRFLLERV